MYELKIKADFGAAHNLRGYEGACESLHGHNFMVEVFVRSSKLNDIGLAIDFKELKGYTKEVIARLDHKYLNEIDPFNELNPSSENIAKYIYDELDKLIDNDDITLSRVSVYESLNSSATYMREE